MTFLDGDNGRLSHGGRPAARDIVQFVPYRKALAHGPLASTKLASEVLAEIPRQLVDHFMLKGVAPPPPPAAAPVPLAPATTAQV